MAQQETPFEFHVPLQKSLAPESTNGEKLWCIEGVAATEDRDQQDEIMSLSGMDFGPFLKSGVLNWNHQDNPSAIIGEPIEAKVLRKSGKDVFFVKGFLYKHQPMAQQLWTHINGLQKSSDPISRGIGWSVQGGVMERRGATLAKSVVRHVAVTHEPVNAMTWAALAKSLRGVGVGDPASVAINPGQTRSDMSVLTVQNLDPEIFSELFKPCPKRCVDPHKKSFHNGLHGMLDHLVLCKGLGVPEATAFVTAFVHPR